MGKISLLGVAFLAILVLPGISPQQALADGNEVLGPPSIAIASGTGAVLAGTGLNAQPGTIDFDVPAGATVKQVLLYWYGRGSGDGVTGDDQVVVDGSAVTGTLIGGSLGLPFPPSQTYRADITSLGLVSAGLNSLTISGMNFTYNNDGAGVIVIFDDGSGVADIQIRDGHDFAAANQGIAPPLDQMVPQTFTLAPSDANEMVTISLFVADGEASRPDAVEITVGAVSTMFVDVVVAGDGHEWDTLVFDVEVPAGETMVTVEVISYDDPTTIKPDSIAWIAAVLSGPITDTGEGCSPGYWKNHLDMWPPTGLSPADDFDTTFGVDLFDPDITLEQAVRAKGGGVKKLARHGTAALLSALHPDVDYPYTAAEVIAMVQAGDIDPLVVGNELGCPID